jgi:glutamine amidotransferase-like uncharacterized protein
VEQLTSLDPKDWTKWGKYVANMLLLRTNAIKLLERREFCLSDLFPNARGPIQLLSRTFVTYSKFYERKDSEIQFLKSPRTTLKDHSLFTPGTVWLNAERGPAIDIWSVYENKQEAGNKKFTIMILQCKFTSKGKTKLDDKQIIETKLELEKMWASIKQAQKNSKTNYVVDLEQYDEPILAIVTNRHKIYRLENQQPKADDVC